MARPTTILVLLDAAVLRAEVKWRRGRATIERLQRSERIAREAADAIDEAAIGAPLLGPVLVLSDEVFLQTLELAPKVIAGLDDRALTTAIAFEARTFSGIDGETITEWWRSGAEREFLVAQFAANEIAAIAAAVERADGTLLGVAHPAAVPAALRDGAAFVRREEWGAVRAVVRGGGATAERVHVSRGRGALDDQAIVTEQLVVSAGTPALPGAARFDLGDDAAVNVWLARWAESVDADAPHAVLMPPETSSDRNRRLLFATVALAAVVGLGVLDRTTVQQEVLAASTELTALRAPLDRLRAAEAEVDALTQQLAALQNAPAAPPAPVAVAWSAPSLSGILEALAACRPSGVVLDELQLGWRRCHVRGRAQDPLRVDAWTAALSPELARFGYSVVPGGREKQPAEQGGLFAFQFELQQAVARPAPAPTEDR